MNYPSFQFSKHPHYLFITVDPKYAVRFHIKATHLFLILKLAHNVINKLTPHVMSKIQNFSHKFMQQHNKLLIPACFNSHFRFQLNI